MLKILRDNLKYLSWILWIVILVFVIFVFVDFGGGLGPRQGQTSGGAVVTLGSESISQREFAREYQRLEAQYRQAFGGQWNAEMADRMQLPKQALQRLVDRKLLVGEAGRAGLEVSDRDVRDAILAIPALQDAGGSFVGEEDYQRFLRGIGYTTREFEQAVRDDIAIQRFSTLLTSGIAIPEAEVEKSWREQNEKGAIRYLMLPAARFQAAAQAGKPEVEAYFAAHAEDFRLPEQRVVDYLLVDEAKLREQVVIDRAEIERQYAEKRAELETPEQVHARHILVKVDENRTAEEARKRMAEAQARLAKGESFEKVAAAYSDDPGSKDRGGDLGFFARGAMVAPFEEAAFGAAAGATVGPIETSFGLHLIEVLERRAGRLPALAEVEGQIRSRLAGERAAELAEKRARDLAARLRSASAATEEGFKALADGATVVQLTTPPFGREETVPGIGRGGEFVDAAFALAAGGTSQPVQVPRGWALLRLRETRPAHAAELAEVESKVRAAVERQKASQLAVAELGRAKGELAAGRTLDQIAQALGAEARDSGEFTRGGAIPGIGSAPALAEAALALPPGSTGGPVAVEGGAVLFQVTARTPFDAARFSSEREATRVELQRGELQKLLATTLQRRREEVGVKYDPTFAERLGLNGAATG